MMRISTFCFAAFLLANSLCAQPSAVRKVTVQLTDAQIKALPTTPIQMLPAPGVGKMYAVVIGVAALDVTAGTYSNIGVTSSLYIAAGAGSALSAAYDENWDGALQDSSAIHIIHFAPMMGAQAPAHSLWNADKPNYENLPLTIKSNNGASGNFTGGHAANTLRLTVYYVIVDL